MEERLKEIRAKMEERLKEIRANLESGEVGSAYLISIFRDTDKKNYLVLLNNSRDTGKDYMSMYDIRTVIDNNIDYTMSKKYYIKDIDRYIMDGEILTLNKKLNSVHQSDVMNMRKMAMDLVHDRHGKEGR